MKSELEITGSQENLKIILNGNDITESVLDYSLHSNGFKGTTLRLEIALTKIKMDT